MSASWLSLESALDKALSAAHTVTECETVSLFSANNRIVATDIVATLDVPPWDNSAMDGYAVNTAGLSTSAPLEVQGTITAGMAADTPLSTNRAFKIMTGAPVPPNADAVVMVENTEQRENKVIIKSLPTSGENIRLKANDISAGEVLIAKGTRLNAEHLMLLSSQGLDKVSVYRKLKVGVVATGSELAQPGDNRSSTQIFESNRVGVCAILGNENLDIVDFGIVEDDKDSLQQLFESAIGQVDIMVSSGGVSVGDADYVKEIINRLGGVDFWKVAIKPGKPFALGYLQQSDAQKNSQRTLFCGLPGNPVSSFVTAKLLVVPVIRKMQGQVNVSAPLTMNATLTHPIKRRAGRRDFQRATMHKMADGGYEVTPFKTQSSGVMTSITSANCFMILHEDVSQLDAGDTVPVMPFTL